MGLLARALDADAGDVGRSVEAAAAIVLARLSLRFVRLEVLARLSDRLAGAAGDVRGGTAPEDETCDRAARAATVAGAVLGATCLPRSLALQWMLARRGVASDLCVGFPREGARFPGHAWIEVGARPLGADAADGERGDPAGGLEVLCRLPRREERRGSAPA